MRIFSCPAELALAVGEMLGPGPGVLVDQVRIAAFADATDDHQWIHLDVDRAVAGPFGGTVAHGYLTLSLLPALVREIYRCDGVRIAINYGLNRARFPAPLRSGSVIHASLEFASADPVPGGLQVVSNVTVQAEGADRPCCVAETVSRLYLDDRP